MTAPRQSSIGAALGNLQHARKGPQPVPESLNTQIPSAPDTRAPAAALPLQGTAKRMHPDFTQLKAYVRADTKRAAMRKGEDDGFDDFSELIQHLLDKYLRT